MRRALLLLLGIILLASSCTSDKVMTSHAVQKRKYRSGLYFSGHAKSDRQHNSYQPKSQSIQGAAKHTNEVQREYLPKSSLATMDRTPRETVTVNKEDKARVKVVEQVGFTLKSVSQLVNSSFRKRLRPSQDYYEEQSQPTSRFGITGFAFGLCSLALLIGAFLIQSIWALLLALFALIFALLGLINSIKGLKDSYEFDRKGKVYSYIGLFTSATVLVISALILFLVILSLIAFIA
jgi:hypothetical protein